MNRGTETVPRFGRRKLFVDQSREKIGYFFAAVGRGNLVESHLLINQIQGAVQLGVVERSMGILPLEDGSLRFSANGAHPSSYSRKTGAGLFRLESDRNEGRIFIDERLAIVFPAGLLVFADGGGRVAKIANAVPRTVSGSLVIDGAQHRFSILPNQLLGFDRGEFTVLTEGGFIAPP